MPFFVTATSSESALSIQVETPAAAAAKARELSAAGMLDVLIADPKGQIYSPAEFDRLFLQTP
jgi:hypothetical protein